MITVEFLDVLGRYAIIPNSDYFPAEAWGDLHHINGEYTTFEIYWKYFFILLNCLFLFAPSEGFIWRMREIPRENWGYVQNWLLAFSPLIILFNDPLLPWAVYEDDQTEGLIVYYTVIIGTFLAALLLFFLCILHQVKSASDVLGTHSDFSNSSQSLNQAFSASNLKFYVPKILLTFVIWILFLFISSFSDI